MKQLLTLRATALVARCLALIALLNVTAASAQDMASYTSSGRPVAVEIFRPHGQGPWPAVLLLHGRSGMSFYGNDFRSRAKELAKHGFVVLIPHYFDATASADSPEITKGAFDAWQLALHDALKFAADVPGVDAKRIGVIGLSLGGFFGAIEAAQNAQVAALVSEGSGLSHWFPSAPVRMPPLLIVHSRDDTNVPLAEANELAGVAKKLGVESEFALYDGRAHTLTGATAQAALDREIDFLLRTLGR
jgi:dienelactone hydrolase